MTRLGVPMRHCPLIALVLSGCAAGMDTPPAQTIALEAGGSATEPAALPVRMDASAAGMALDAGSAALSIRVEAWGRGEELGAVQAVAPVHASDHVRYRHGDIESWWDTEDGAPRQGFDLLARPAGEGLVRIEMGTGLALADAAADGQSVSLLDEHEAEWTVAGLRAWDADGDVLAARFVDVEGGFAIEVDDTGADWPIHVDPVYTTSTSSVSGSTMYYYFAFDVAIAGDTNGDGYDDVLVGSFGASGYQGRLYVYAGGASGVDSTSYVECSGPSTPAYLGYTVTAAGDVNGDGYADVAGGALAYDAYRGRVYVFNGSASGVSTTADTEIPGPSMGSYAGYGLAGAGDVDGDGYDDLLVGYPGYAGFTGRAGIHYGSSSGTAAGAGDTADGTSMGSYFGYGLDGAGDLDGDGYDDVAIGAPYESMSTGAVEVYLGYPGVMLSSPTETLTGPSTGSYFGYAVSGLGDADGDGYDDLAVSAFGYNTYQGRVQIYPGSGSGIDSSSYTSIDGPASGYFFGISIGSGEFGGDRMADLVVGAYGYDGYRGAAYVYEGTTSGMGTTESASFTGSARADYFGYSVDGAGDIDGDGRGDVIVGAYGYNSNRGIVYVFGGYGDYDADGDGYDADDCDDDDASIYPGAPDTAGDGIDSDCDGYEVCFNDADGDGYTDGTTVTTTQTDCNGSGVVDSSAPDGDCDDNEPLAYPGATEVAGDGIDEDCDGSEICYVDADDDGYTTGATISSTNLACDGSGEATATEPDGDCDDTDPTVNPGATDIPGDAVDRDCDGVVYCYADADGDGYTDGSLVVSEDDACDDPGEADDRAPDGDCDDADASRNPGAEEVTADGVDSDCDGNENCYADNDDDGFTDGSIRVSRDEDCTDVYEADADTPTGDCDDSDPDIYPGAPDIEGDGIDSDCEGAASCLADVDGDGYSDGSVITSEDADCSDPGELELDGATGDCDDEDDLVNPGATEEIGDEIDSDCDGIELCYADGDVDGYTAGATMESEDALCRDDGELTADDPDGDCDDTDADAYPGAPEIIGDGIDQDCDGMEECYVDADGDGYTDGSTVASTSLECDGSGEADDTVVGGDCEDDDASVNPGAVEVVGDGIDSDCDGTETCYADLDGDGYSSGDSRSSSDADCDDAGEALASEPGGDCNDIDPTINPGATEEVGDEIDQDCDGTELCIADADLDGYAGSDTVVSADTDCDDAGEKLPAVAGEDCDDANAATYPGAPDDAGDEIDSDCDGVELCFVDADEDGFAVSDTVLSADTDCDDAMEASASDPSDDCDDTNPAIYPGAEETDCEDPTDYNCDGSVGFADDDADGFAACVECDDANAAVNPDATEICNEIDDDCDGTVDGGGAVDAQTFYADADGDGWTNSAITAVDCAAPPGFAEGSDPDDCDDARSDIYPGAPEVADDGIDQDCDGVDLVSPPDTGDTGDTSEPPDTGETGDTDDTSVDTDPGLGTDTGPSDVIPEGGIDEGDDAAEDGGCGCAAPTGGAGAAGLLGAVALGLVRRRR